jgi:hypothetical protein
MTRGSNKRVLRLAVIAGLAAGGLVFAQGTAGSAPCSTCPETPQPDPSRQERAAEQELADKYTPIVYLRNQREACDKRGSPYAPAPVEFLFDVDDIVLKKHEDGRTTEEARAFGAAELFDKGDEYFIDLPGNPKRPGCTYERDYLARADDYTPVAYAHIAREEGRGGFALQYWLFYYFNDWNNGHEGDWEMVQLTFDGPTAVDALTQEPAGAGYSQHGGGEQSDWDDPKLSKDGDHPIAHVAAGANANLFEPDIIVGRGENGTGFGCDDASRPSRRVTLEARLMDEPTDASSEYAWLTYDGRWGERAPWEFNGPTGPNDKRAWREPFSWQEDLRPSSITVPESRIGPNAVNFFCDVVWYLSSPVVWLFRIPTAGLVAGAVVAGSGLVYLATRTQYRPALLSPLRRRRRFGQLLRSAARLYQRNVALFLGIGLVVIPVGFLEAAAQWALFTPPYVDTVSRFFADRLAVKAAIALAVGNVASSLVYWFVGCLTTGAVSRLEDGLSSSRLADYRAILGRVPQLIIPRLKALAIIVLLALSVVGIPWAIRNGVRWTFIEETILLDGAPPQQARNVSARAVDGRWWHTFFCLAALGLLGYGLGPALGFALLLATPFSVAWINVVSALVFTLVGPFVFICQALIYFDLTTPATPAGDDAP